MPRKSAFFGLLLVAVAPLPAFALGLGEIRLESSLNEPLEAYIELISVEPADLDVFAAQVASLETFNRYGLDRPDFLADLRFVMARGRSDQPVLKVVSTRPITEPFVTFLVEANWTRGRLLREYTVLLDPPVFNTESAPPAVAAPQSATSQLAPQAGFVPRPEPQPAPAPRRTREPVIASSGSSYGPVRRNQTLWEIAASAREGSGLTMNQMMIAIYRENPDAFMGNINLLKEGSTLRIPDAASAARVAQRDALATAVAHNDAWRAGGKVSGSSAAPARSASTTSPTSSAPTADAPRRLKLVAPDGSAASGADAAAVADLREALEDERTRSADLADDVASLRRELEETKRLFSLKSSDMAELQARLATQQNDVDAAEFVPASVDSGADDGTGRDASGDDGSVDAAAALAAAAEGGTPGGNDGASSGEDAGSTDPLGSGSDTPDSPGATTAPVGVTPPVTAPPAPIQSAPGLLDRVLGWWPYLLGLLALGAGGVFLAMRRRDSSDGESWDSLTADSGTASQPADATIPAARAVDAAATEEVEYFEDTGTFKPVDFAGSGVDDDAAAGERGDFPFEEAVGDDDALKLDQSDPLAEADFHMAYGLYDQAAELVSAASARDPSRRDLKMKLLEIYFVWGNKESFRDAAAALREDIGDTADADWDKILIMGKQICPDEALFSGGATGGGSDDIDLQLDDTGSADALDLETGMEAGADDGVDLDLGEALGAASASAAAADNVIDFDFGGETTTASDDADEALRARIRSATEDADDTEEMDLAELGVDLDFGETGAYDDADDAFSGLAASSDDERSDSTSVDDAGDVISMSQTQAALDIDDSDFDELFGGLDESSDAAPSAEMPAGTPSEEERDKLLDTSELKVEMEELLNAGSMLSDDDDPTAGALQSLDDPADDAARTGSFSAEIRSLTGSDFDDVDLQFDEQASAGGDDDTALMPSITDHDDDDTDLVQGIDESGDEDTVLAETLFEEPPAAAGDDATAQLEAAGESVDFDDIFGADDATQLSKSPFADDGTSELASFDGVFGDTDDAPQVDAEAVDIFGGAETSEVDADAADIFGGGESAEVDDDAAEIFGSGDDGTVETGGVDLDVGEALHESGDGTTVRVAAADLALPDSDETSTSEIGTKLDLARAYMEMGDPDGARGILQEVIEEGDSDQQQDARALMDALPS